MQSKLVGISDWLVEKKGEYVSLAHSDRHQVVFISGGLSR